MEIIQKLMIKRKMKQQVIKVIPLKKLMVHIKEKQMALLRKKIHEFSEGEK